MIQRFLEKSVCFDVFPSRGWLGTSKETWQFPPPPSKDEELSVNLESTMVLGARLPEDCIRLYPGYGLAAITASHARSLQQTVARDPLPEEPAHGVVYGPKKRGGIAGKLRDGAAWVVMPNRSEV